MLATSWEDVSRSSLGSGEQKPYRLWFRLHLKAVQPRDPPTGGADVGLTVPHGGFGAQV